MAEHGVESLESDAPSVDTLGVGAGLAGPNYQNEAFRSVTAISHQDLVARTSRH